MRYGEKGMNILFVTAENDRFSGAFLSLVKLASLLQNEYNHKVTVVLPRHGSGRELLVQNNIKNIIIRSGTWSLKIDEKNKLKTKFKFCIKNMLNHIADCMVVIVIKFMHIDLVHLNSSWTCIGAKPALKYRIPLIWHIREFLEEDQGRQLWHREKGYELMRKATHMKNMLRY